MKTVLRRKPLVPLLTLLVLLLVPALAVMQYRWLGQLSDAERERMQRTLRTSAMQFARDYDGELSRAQTGLTVEGAMARDENWVAYAERYSTWAERAADPRLVNDVLLVDAPVASESRDPALAVPVDTLRVRRWHNERRAFEPSPWPAELDHERATIARQLGFLRVLRTQSGGRFRGEGTITMSIRGGKTLMAPVTLLEFAKDVTAPPRINVLGFTIVQLNLDVVRETILPGLAGRHFQAEGAPATAVVERDRSRVPPSLHAILPSGYRLAVIDREDPSTIIWESEAGAARTVLASPDVRQDFAAARPEQIFIVTREKAGAGPITSTVAVPPPPPLPPPPPTGENVFVSVVEGRGGNGPGPRVARVGGTEGRWTLLAQHRAGSLEAAVTAARTRNLALSSGVLVLLTMAIGLIVVSARRAQDLARQQMEFVAAVSHELRTPVSVIGTAAGNLADGVVSDPARVRTYGETIRGESRRLAETVERVLQLAGIESGRMAATRVRLSADELVAEAVRACAPQIESAGIEMHVDVADDLPMVEGDRAALLSALQNLVTNAVKYGGRARWVRVSARVRESSGYAVKEKRLGSQVFQIPAVDFIVEDHGLGIPAEDREHIFEPFYRGREAVAQQIQGSGLGLNLVQRIAEAHGGRVTVTSEPGQGSTFTFTLPAAIDLPAPVPSAARAGATS